MGQLSAFQAPHLHAAISVTAGSATLAVPRHQACPQGSGSPSCATSTKKAAIPKILRACSHVGQCIHKTMACMPCIAVLSSSNVSGASDQQEASRPTCSPALGCSGWLRQTACHTWEAPPAQRTAAPQAPQPPPPGSKQLRLFYGARLIHGGGTLTVITLHGTMPGSMEDQVPRSLYSSKGVQCTIQKP